jgi:hypothetical protein
MVSSSPLTNNSMAELSDLLNNYFQDEEGVLTYCGKNRTLPKQCEELDLVLHDRLTTM